MSNCLFEALIQETERNCSCTPFGFNLSVPNCHGSGLDCKAKVFEKLGKTREIMDDNNNSYTCKAACETQLYSLLVTSGSYPNEVSFRYSKALCYTTRKIFRTFVQKNSLKYEHEKLYELVNEFLQNNMTENDICPPENDYTLNDSAFGGDKAKIDQFKMEIFKYARNNIAYITVYIREPFAEETRIAPQVTLTALLSDVGGLLGLFMGCSVVTFVEIIYHVSKVNIQDCCQKKANSLSTFCPNS